MVGIKDFEIPNTCGDCPFCIYTADEKRYIGYCNTSDDDYYCKALDRFMEYDKVDGGVDILGKPSDCPLVEAIPKANVYKTIQEMMKYEHEGFINISLAKFSEIIQQQIDAL